jgi:peptidyl-prolyl cis-trans isomerase SurA
MKVVKGFCIGLAAFLCVGALLTLPAWAEIVDRVVAIVNDDFITLRDVERYVRVESEGRFVSVNEYFRNIRLQDRIDSFIDDLLIKQQAKKLRIDASDKELEGIVANIRKQYLITEDELKQQLSKEGIPYKDFVEGIRMNLLRTRVLGRVISPDVVVTDAQLKEYYNKHIEEYRNEEYKLQQIFVSAKREDAQRRALTAYGLLREGKPFDVVAKEFSDDPSAGTGGDMGYVKREELIPELREPIRLLTPGAFTAVLKTPYGLHILRLVDVNQGDTLSFDQVKERIHTRIVQEESEKKYKDYITKLRATSYIEVKF